MEGKLVWLTGHYGEKELWVRTIPSCQRVLELLIQERRYDAPAKISSSLGVGGQLIEIAQSVRSFGNQTFGCPMTLPHFRVQIPNGMTRLAREWCSKHGFENVIAEDTGRTEYDLVVYSGFHARIWPKGARAWVGNGDNDPTPVKRFPINCGIGATLVTGGPEFDGYAGIQFPNDIDAECEFRNLLSYAACWLAEWQIEHGWNHDSDWPGWSDETARAYTVALFQTVQLILDGDDFITACQRVSSLRNTAASDNAVNDQPACSPQAVPVT